MELTLDEKTNNTQTYTMTYKKINKHTQIHNLNTLLET